ncbi:hypothetical protein [Tateyamaria omphalii]|uniref:hypothetical protein n=1 Tax=Tateyamaria omphalii TaxID=299262 RepID=UPI0034A0CAC8
MGRSPPYRPGGVLSVGFTDRVPEFDDIKAGTAASPQMPTDAPALVVFGYAFGSQAGDRMRLRIDGPDGELIDETLELDRPQAQLFRAVGKKLTSASWPAGEYTGTVTLQRDGREIDRVQGTTIVR